MAFLRDVHPDDKIRLHQWQAESRNKHRDGGGGGGDGREGGERFRQCTRRTANPFNNPSERNGRSVTVLTPLTDGRQRLSGQRLSRDDTNRSDRVIADERLGGFPI